MRSDSDSDSGVWTMMRRGASWLGPVGGRIAAWALVLALVGAGTALLWPVPNLQRARNLTFRPEMIQGLKPGGWKGETLPGGRVLRPGETLGIVFRSSRSSFQGPPVYPRHQFLYRTTERTDGARVVNVEVTGWSFGFGGRSEGTRMDDAPPLKSFTIELNPAGDIVGIALPEGSDGGGAMVAMLSALFEPSRILPARDLRPGDRWVRTASGSIAGFPRSWFRFTTTMTLEGFVSFYGVEMAHVSGDLEGTCGGLFLPELPGRSDGPGLHIVSRRFETKVHYFFDPESGRLLGGLHADSPVRDIRASRVRGSQPGEFVDQEEYDTHSVWRTSFTAAN